VPWGSVRLRAEVLLVAYLDDIYCSSEAFLIQPYRRTLRAIAKPLVGLEFTSVAKNYTYVPRCFAAEVRTMFPDAMTTGRREQFIYGSTKAWSKPIACRVSWPTCYTCWDG
jgi:hypothetical protein